MGLELGVYALRFLPALKPPDLILRDFLSLLGKRMECKNAGIFQLHLLPRLKKNVSSEAAFCLKMML